MKTKIPNYVKNDPYLKPYTEIINKRLERATELESKITGGKNNLKDFACGHDFFGLHKLKDKWIFREWAPNATEIFLIGDFTNWHLQEKFSLQRKHDGIWEIELPLDAMKHNQLYRLFVRWNGGQGDRIPAWSRRVVQDEYTKIFNAQVWDPEKPYKWKHSKFKRNTDVAPIIYEAHVGMADEAGKVGLYVDFRKNVLPKIIKAGYNTIQLMAIQEHPYYGSFGYHVANFFAPSSRFGTPEELKELIDEAHAHGIAVIMDLVHSHSVKNEVEGIGKFDGTPYQYFHDGARGNHIAWDSRCFDYSKGEVLHFLLSNCKYWLEEFDFDGYRFDGVTSMLYYDHGLGTHFTSYDAYFNGGQDGDAIAYLIMANKLIHTVKPKALTIAEEVSGLPGLATPLKDGGMGFDYRLAMGVPDFWIKLIKEYKDEDWNVGWMFHELSSKRDDEKTIGYAESHDQALVGDKTIIFRLIDEDMYWDMHVAHENMLIDRGLALHRMIRLITMANAGGGYLNFMGNEFGHPEWIDFPREGNGWSYHYARRQWSLMDNPELRYKFLGYFDRDIVELIKEHNIMTQNRAQLLCEHISDQILIFQRGDLIFAFNFSPTKSYTGYSFDCPKGDYRIVLNTDSGKYGGHMRIDENTTYHSVEIEKDYAQMMLYLPTQTGIVLKKI